MKQVSVEYFAVLREQAGCSAESIETEANTCGELYGQLQAAHAFTLPLSLVKFAVGESIEGADQPIQDGDVIVLIPPVAGG